MIDLKQFKSRVQTYARLDYAGDFDGFWRWKLRTETKNEHILDNSHRRETYRRLCNILPRWLTYRPYDSAACLGILENSLESISDAYDNETIFKEATDEFTVRVSQNPAEIKELLEVGFEYVCEKDGLVFFRKRK